LPRLTGQGSIQLSALRGKPIVLNFWSSSCTVCMQESPAIAQVARASQNRVAFVGIDVYDVRKAAIAFVDKYHLPYQMAFDSEGVAASKYDVPALPETFFLSGSGQKILAINLGALTSTRLKAILRSLYGITV
jgi:cytochrome c biogenesis protein CcmG/thiol:disulfide interchange protein DsbE